ncbi:2-amino-4-hydroxy-6-hydroxymethyldihydropteridinepyrophosphokinase [Candidatus Erwinia haradaeae]|uniref:2-amino-4-hydroxy-6-hydroxymethyldihydropteridine pyrophosphokinase n=1 Tax=Candidatus Erwinia haradaeae TaxID=1922217 RepID=A0A451DCR1_9GAMM|nr:2-amino-4-hydroxy-6-hydroxymethyldihydropteridine diphosphokinase [Candidatus Erwinia haradaeae]VFP84148.1 2-amino-4-hydroxy-6-hydroxymethyldihydropteridinepyrophosphokinase [Candidatus Erwinia haradaeae]
MNRAYLSLGSNLCNPLHQICRALERLASLPYSHIANISHLYHTPPYGQVHQSHFLNTVVALDTYLDPEELLNKIQCIEIEQKRCRQSYRWGPRTLDVDIMLFNKQTINTPQLIIPHYDMHNRAFMLKPLIDIAPSLCLPNGKNLSEILKTLNANAIHKVVQSSFDLQKSQVLLQKN